MSTKKENVNLVHYDEVLKRLRSQPRKDNLYHIESLLNSKNVYLVMLTRAQQLLLNILDISKSYIKMYSIDDMLECLESICTYQMVYLHKLHHEVLSYETIMNSNRELFIKKNNDYGSSFEDFGFIGIIVRLNDKINRIKSLMNKSGTHEVENEAIDDSVQDLYNYCVLGMMYKFKKD